MIDDPGELGGNAEEILDRYRRVYHMTESGSWRNIRRHGLLSTEALLDLFEVPDSRRRELLCEHRPESITISHPDFGAAVVRDQKPMSYLGLERALEDSDLSPEDWLRFLNEKVFFWVTRERVQRLLCAQAYRDREHEVLVVRTEPLVTNYYDQIVLSSMNSGATKPYPHPRDETTFQGLEEYPLTRWKRKRSGSRTEPVVELAVDYAVPDVWGFVERVEVWKRDDVIRVPYDDSEPGR